ncbi:FG-GAP-like repeat-containing protein [Streptomyces chilikensis]|uniref:FG-GAP-like repeat-containing protein n=1 Tax=Streptomyces chilikensis TaxID=1194079 RepID=A0ABV3EJ44_9ACTN
MSRARGGTRSARLGAPLAAAALLAGGLGAWSLTTATAQAAPTPSVGVQDDFNRDGYADLVVGAPNATVSGAARAGYVAVTYGSSSGIDTAKKKIVSRSTSGVPGAATADQRFGATFAKGDLDGDGYGDLVVGGGTAGSVILWGSASGLTGGTAVAGYGTAPQIGDFDGDGKADLALFSAQRVGGDDPVGAPATVWKGPVTRAGAPKTVLPVLDKSLWWGWEEEDASCDTGGGCENGPASITGPVVSGQVGDVNGDGRDDIVQWHYTGDGTWGNRLLLGGGATGFTRGWIPGDSTSSTPAGTGIGDVNGDGYDDVVVGAEDWSDKVRIAYGSASGPSEAKTVVLDQDSPGIPGAQEEGDLFGSSVSVADMTGDGYADIALGVAGEDIGTVQDAGAVVLVPGSAAGVTGAGAKAVNQDTAGIPGVGEAGDMFGVSTALLDVNGNGHRDLAVGTTAENSDNGAVWVLRGGSAGLSTKNAFAFGAADVGAPATDAWFGAALR